MESGTMNYGVWIFLLLLFFIFTGGNFLGNRSNGCDVTSNCDIEKSVITNTARVQYGDEVNANRVIEAGNINTRDIMAQSSRQYEAGLQEKIFDLKIDAQTRAILQGQEMLAKDGEIAALKSQIYTDNKFAVVNAELRDIKCSQPIRPPYYAQGYVPTGCEIPCGVTA